MKPDADLLFPADDAEFEIVSTDAEFDRASVFAQAEQVVTIQIASIILSKLLFFTLLTSKKCAGARPYLVDFRQ